MTYDIFFSLFKLINDLFSIKKQKNFILSLPYHLILTKVRKPYFMKRALLIVFLFTLVFNIIHPNNCWASNINLSKNQSEWKKFKSSETYTAKKLAQNNAYLKLGKHDALNLKKLTEDELGYKHYHYQQSFKGIPIEATSYSIHELNGRVQSANGHLIRNININVRPSIKQEEALLLALENCPSNQYAWQDALSEKTLKLIKKDEAASYYPEGNLVIMDNRLSYKFDVYSLQPLSRKNVFIDAHNGELIQAIEKLHFCAAFTASGKSNYNEQINFTSCYDEGAYLLRNSLGGGMQVIDQNTGSIISESDEFFDEDKAATEIHWATQKTYEYFLSEHDRNSLDDKGMPLVSVAHATLSKDSLNNAFWDGEKMSYGDGDGERYGSFTSLDIVAHEMMHGITQNSGDKLTSTSISRALNESFSDIFGEVVEAANKKDGPDWITGADIVILPGYNGIRNLANPNDGNMIQIQPDTYQGKYWADTNALESVHINSGVQNHWFYLLAEGGSGVNDKGGAYFIQGIGIEKAAKIAYRNLVHYLDKNSNYSDARNGAIQAAIDLFKEGSTEVEQTIAAWCAVGVGEDCDHSDLTCRQKDSLNLINLYIATEGANWKTPWDTSQSVKNWMGIGFNEQDCVKSIQLIDNNLRGHLPEVIGNFSDLEKLILSKNNLTGAIPKQIGELAKLTTLNLNNTGLGGIVPDEIKSLIQLQNLDLSRNNFEGVVLPKVLYYLKELRSIDLSNNNFSGKIPNGTFTLPKLEVIDLSHNDFNGIIPQQLPYFPVLNGLTLSNNNFTGEIPNSFDRMPNVKTILLDTNLLEGALPGKLSELKNLVKLQVNNNNLSGCYDKSLALLNNQLLLNTNEYISNGNQFDQNWEDFTANNDLACAPKNCRQTDSLSLVQLYESANGADWNVQWDFSQPMDTWEGVTLNFDGCAGSLCLDYNFGLSGYLDPVIGNLSQLEELAIYEADFEGGIPTEIGQLQNLNSLTLSNSKLGGEIPAQIGQLEKLEYLNLASNALSGSIPAEIGNLSALDVLILEYNQLTGNIPKAIAKLTQLTQLRINDNYISGLIPAEMSNLNLLKNLNIHANLINGDLPLELGNLNNLEFINLSNNLLSGCYDTNLRKLCEQIYPGSNKNRNISEGNNFNIAWEDFCTYGANICTSPCRINDSLALKKIQTAMGGGNWRYKWDLSKPMDALYGVQLNSYGCVEALNLSNNKLYGYIPTEIGQLKSLTTLNLANNSLSGEIPAEISKLKSLETLNLSNNQLSGEIPHIISDLQNLNFLWLADNNISGQIPASFSQLIYLQNLNLSENNLTGVIPTSFTTLPQLSFLYLFDNQLSGCYNTKLKSLCETLDPFQNLLGTFRISRGNNFDSNWEDFCDKNTGACQTNPCRQADSLTLVTLYNETDGVNWNSFYQWNFNEPMSEWRGVTLNDEGCVFDLSLPAVGLKNELPKEIGNLSYLSKLNLWGNQLSGEIPASIGNLEQLEILYLPNNQFTGNIPPEICELENLSQLYLHYNQLSGDISNRFKNLKSLQLLELHNNQLTGSIPAALADLPELRNLELQNNLLSSCYPMALQNLCDKENAAYWKISEGNNFEAAWAEFCIFEMGSCPVVYGTQTDSLTLLSFYAATEGEQWTNIWDLDQPMSTWHGVQVNEANRVTGLNVSNNNLNGFIIDDLENLNLLQAVDLSNNQLVGQVPASLGNIENLTDLNLHHNNLKGCFAQNLTTLCDQLNASNNNLDEQINEGNQFQASWEDFCEGGVEVCYSGDVWPGDYSNNGIVDVYDVLYWGLAKGNSGTARQAATTSWSAQPAQEWQHFLNGINGKHQDGNGDGIVDDADFQLIDIHYGRSHDLNINPSNQNTSNLDLKAVGIAYNDDGISISYDLNINTEDGEPLNVHGIAGNVDLGDLPVKDVQVDIANSSIEAEEFLVVHNEKNNTIDLGITRLNQINKPANGSVARIVVAIEDIAVGTSFVVKTNGGNTISANGTLNQMGGSSTYGSFNPNDNLTQDLSVFVSTKAETCDQLGEAELFITNGTAPFTYAWSNGNSTSKMSDLPSGDYTVTVSDVAGLTAEIDFKIYGQLPVYNENNEIECSGNCADYLEANSYLNNGVYKAGNSIQSKGVISKRENIEFKAGESILLENGFSIDVDSNFSAEIESCE